jgi:hypothetical protein
MFVDGSNTVEIYTPASSPTYQSSWQPTISTVPTTVTAGNTYQIYGTQFNGLSNGSAFGDESQNATNYPLVRIANTATGHVFYARTHDHSTMAVATGNAQVSTNFDVPGNIENGASTIQVIANGIPSQPVPINVVSTVVPPVISGVHPNSGTSSGGTTVNISGSNFSSGATVSFGGASAKVAAVTPSSITVTSPAHAPGLVSVSVTNANGETATLSNAYTYKRAAPAITHISPNSGSVNGGTNVNIQGSNFVSGATISFGGTKATQLSFSPGSIHVKTPANIRGVVDVVLTNPDGQSATIPNGFTFR